MKKEQQEIIDKLGIAELNEMQIETQKAISNHKEVVLLSPTGSGKTLAFLLPLIANLDPESEEIQALILVPSRELAIQIEQVTREMGSGYKINAVYGGRSGSKDKMELKHTPAILIGTPGRVADHIRRENISTQFIKTLVLDEFDKSLETGFEKEMKEIVESLPALDRKILTSATQKAEIPEFLRLIEPKEINFLGGAKTKLKLQLVVSPTKNKLETLANLLAHIGNANGIIFCNLKDTISGVSTFLEKRRINHECFFGGMEQIDRERALIKFRNGSSKVLVATDLAARGIDVPALDYIIHFQLPPREDEFTHRNGRTARMNSNGTAYILKGKDEKLPSFISGVNELKIDATEKEVELDQWTTLFVSGGRKDKISKGDIAGLFFKQGQLGKEELGNIELKQDCAFVAVPTAKAHKLIASLNNTKLKTKKVRISELK
ncbi:DEAD/DEAH box helicase [Arcticibacterium luteifluviistationis]|uniref:Helicase n=1 Tax=Arcticibacterium luteifluviistationis TaxID=1784714 RepID=A0A2Z4GCP4_9BACT|nr:DEAD/DEAH box helicase [Arcticibacterium luteifluviistationis]AWV98805.1 helicase [Arcticibacterium luteifluviistationis]